MGSIKKPKVCAVSYLNTVPLVWGMMHGPQKALVDLDFALPSECARQLASGEADIGIVPVGALLDRDDYGIFRGAGIACRGAVRSILLISKVPFWRIRKLATDAGSRSSVLLCRIILSKRYNCEPECVSLTADLESMLESADACLIIGDPALRLDPEELRASGYNVADLGEEWFELTGLPMVFAVWAGPSALFSHTAQNGPPASVTGGEGGSQGRSFALFSHTAQDGPPASVTGGEGESQGRSFALFSHTAQDGPPASVTGGEGGSQGRSFALMNAELEAAFIESYRFGREHIEDIVRSEYEARGVTIEAAREYFDRYIVFELGDNEYAGMNRYLELAKEIVSSKQPVGSTQSL